MVIWITGNSGAGKTTYAKQLLKTVKAIHLDGDDIRENISGYDLSYEGRYSHNINTAKWARLLESQGHDVIVSLICPFEELRQEVKEITGCQFIYIEFEGDDRIPDKPYEKPVSPEYVVTKEFKTEKL
jgi:adenylylsulfate kinase-like enzyme